MFCNSNTTEKLFHISETLRQAVSLMKLVIYAHKEIRPRRCTRIGRFFLSSSTRSLEVAQRGKDRLVPRICEDALDALFGVPDMHVFNSYTSFDHEMYRLGLVLWVAAVAAQGPYDSLESRSAYPGKPTSLSPLYTPGLGAASHAYRDNSYEDNAVTPTPAPTPIYRTVNSPQQLYRSKTDGYQNQPAVRVGAGQRGPLRGGPGARYPENSPEAEELIEEEKDEPDRLTLLLPQSKFDCVNKQTGYYADEDLNCEVFHYCQDNAKHSWICPEGFTFHQVHLICMPPSGDISCKKSSQYHFVNEYLYKPLNQDEAQNKPNVTLRYSERYFPADIYTDERDGGDYHGSQQQQASQRRPLPQVFLGQQSTTINSLPSAARPHQPQGLPQYRLPVNQVFRSPEEVNIPLQQRRPQLQQQQQQQAHILRRFPQVRPEEEEYE